MTEGSFLCGCPKESKITYSMQVDANGNLRSVRFDSEGYEICPEHGDRLYGWRTKLDEKRGIISDLRSGTRS